ncbi:MAG: putative maltokinase [candidate division KSB1 bacterium]|nr:putative maltokinase [candidate division KSB1 bacterium]
MDNSFRIGQKEATAILNVINVQFQQGASESYLLPVSFAKSEAAVSIWQEEASAVIAQLRTPDGQGVLYDALYNPGFRENLLDMVQRRKKVKGETGQLVAYPNRALKSMFTDMPDKTSRVLQAQQSNSSILYQDTFFLKLYRKIESGINPDLEIEQYLTEKTSFQHVPPFAGALEWQKNNSRVAIGLLQQFVPNEGDAWSFMLDAVTRYYERVLARRAELKKIPKTPGMLQIDKDSLEPLLWDLIEALPLEMAHLLGRRSGELHNALAMPSDQADFKPEGFSTLYQRSLYQAIRNQVRRTLQQADKRRKSLPADAQEWVNGIVESENDLLNHLNRITRKKIKGQKIRIHGDYHLGQVLYTGKDFMIIDFEGEPAHILSERRLKRSALRDAAGMIRSFHYAAYTPLLLPSFIRQEDTDELEPWAHVWFSVMSGLFLTGYREAVAGKAFVPDDPEEFKILLHVLLLEKAIYELGYEMNNRPEWLSIPIKGINTILKGD